MRNKIKDEVDNVKSAAKTNGVTINISNFLLEAFPLLKGATYIRSFTPLITLYPDTVFYLFQKSPKQFFILVATDYPDPTDEGQQLKKLSGDFKIEFLHLIKPYANDQHVEIRENNDISELFYVDDPKSYYHYYLAEAKLAAEW